MTIRLSAPFAILALCFTGPILAADETTATTAEAADSGSEMVCRKLKVTGSRLGGQRVCKTREQWRLDRQQQRQEIEQSQGRHGAHNEVG